MTSTTTRIRQIGLVCLPTPDQDGAIAFYEALGFEKRTDTPFGGSYRWVEVYPPEGTAGIALAPPPPGAEMKPAETGITLVTQDIDATHADLVEPAWTLTPRCHEWENPYRRCSGSGIPAATP